jgi:O-antigen ligase
LTEVAAYILAKASIRNFCLAYFLLAPLFLNQGMRVPLGPIFLAGYLFSLPIVLLTVARALCDFRHLVRCGRLTLVVLGLASACLVSVLANSPENLLRFEKHFFWYLKFLIPALCFLVMTGVWKRDDISRLYTLLFSLVAFSLILTATQMAFDVPPALEPSRMSAFFRDSNHFALLLDVLLAFTLPIGIRRILDGRTGVGYPVLNLLLLVAVGLTGSRSGFLITAMLAGVSILATRAWRVNMGLATLALPFLILMVAVVRGRYVGGQAALSDMGRLWTYLTGINIVRENPLLGVGFGNILDRFRDYGQVYALLIGRPMDIHNAFLEIFAESGVIAFALFTLLLGVPFYRLARRVAADSRGFYPLADLVGLNICLIYIIHGMVYPEFLGHDEFWAYYSVVILILRERIRDPEFRIRLFGGGRESAAAGTVLAPEAPGSFEPRGNL